MILKQIMALFDAAVRFKRRLRFSVDVFYSRGRRLVCLFLLLLLLCGCSTQAEEPVLETLPTAETVEPSLPQAEEQSLSQTGESSLPQAGGDSPAEAKGPALPQTGESSLPEATDQPAPETVTVHVCGEVRKEGVYSLPAGSRILDAVEAAGGFTDRADRSFLNLAMQIEDAWQIRVPSREETENLSGIRRETGSGNVFGSVQEAGPGYAPGSVQKAETREAAQAAPESGRINLNTASKEELMKIPGVGEAKAQRIIDYREQNGRFETVEDLMKVPGIKNASFQKMKDYITV